MTAKHKLNSAHMLGTLLLAGLIGHAAESLAVFFCLWAFLLALGLQNGDIRL